MLNRIWILILLVPLAPSGQAAFTDSRYHEAPVYSTNEPGGFFVAPVSFTYTKPHGYTVTGGTSVIVWDNLLQVVGNALTVSRARFGLYVDGTVVAGACANIEVERDAGDSVTRYINWNLRCSIPLVTPGSHTVEVRLLSSTNNPVVDTWQTFTLLQTETVTDTTLDGLATQASVNALDTRVANTNRTLVEVWGRLNTTCQKTTNDDCEGIKTLLMGNVTLGNLTINGTGLDTMIENAILTQSQPIADSIDGASVIFGTLIIFLAAVAWAEYSKNVMLYLLALLIAAILTIGLSADFAAYRIVMASAALLLALRALNVYKENGVEEQ